MGKASILAQEKRKRAGGRGQCESKKTDIFMKNTGSVIPKPFSASKFPKPNGRQSALHDTE